MSRKFLLHIPLQDSLCRCPKLYRYKLNHNRFQSDSQHLPRLLENGCTAIVCSHDMLAHSAMLYCLEQGLRIPEGVSILGHDDILLCRYTAPTLTTIRQNRPAIGKSAFYALMSHQNGVPLSSHLLHAELVRRGSCGPAPKEPRVFRLRQQ